MQAADAEALAGLLRKAPGTFVVIEYDRSVWADGQAVAALVKSCRSRAHRGNAAVILIALRMDEGLVPVIDEADRVFYVERDETPRRRVYRLPPAPKPLAPHQARLPAE
jgi:hypothetical protein